MENVRRLVLCYAIQDSVTRTGVDSRLASGWLFGSRVTFVVVVRCKPLVRCFKHMLRRINESDSSDCPPCRHMSVFRGIAISSVCVYT